MFFVRTRRTDDAGVRGRELAERKREKGRAATTRAPTATKGSAMRQGEIVQCQGYMGARA